MNLARYHSYKKLKAQVLLLGIPTVALMAYALQLANKFLDVFQHPVWLQTLAFATGLGAALYLMAYRFRWLPLTALLAGLYLFTQAVAQWLPLEEFDAFFFIIQANNYFFLLLLGWLTGYGFSRSRWLSVLWCVLVLTLMSLIIADTAQPSATGLTLFITPILAYTAYVLYTSELIRNMNEDQTGFTWFVTRRLAGLGLLLGLLFVLAWFQLRPSFLQVEKEWEKGGTPKENSEKQHSLTRNDGMGTSTSNSMGLQGFNNRANKDSLVFVAKLDNFFPDEVTPNPLYFVSDYYTRFDSLTQTFETDTLRPYNDLFSPDLTTMPLYFKQEDTAAVRNDLGFLQKKIVTAEVYKKSLSPRHFTAPATAFFVQPISVPEENKDLYKSAYRAKMAVSELNSAYFVYNSGEDLALAGFQEQRFEQLRKITGYTDAPADFYQYYTQMPGGADYDTIRQLAQAIVLQAGAATPIDQVLAIRDFFMAKDSLGQPTYRYADNPGIPGIPGANRLLYFLLENKKGYCAYYAGATLFLLRALGIPSRIATGFLTVDRSNKNPGWYWFYEDQAHAWVQVWFPGYGWLDFDTTVPSTETQEAPQPDQTPPLTTQTAWLVANGTIATLDTAAKKMELRVKQLMYHDEPLTLQQPVTLQLDISRTKVLRDTGVVSPTQLQAGMDVVAVSFSLSFRNLPPAPGESAGSLIKRWPNPVPADEVKIIEPKPETADSNTESLAGRISWKQMFINLAIAAGCIGLMLLLLPYGIFSYLLWKANGNKKLPQKAYYGYMAVMFYLYQTGYTRRQQTPLQYAKNIDREFGTDLQAYISTYQKIKYSTQALLPAEAQLITDGHRRVIAQLRKQIPRGKRFGGFLQPGRSLGFFTLPSILGQLFNKKTS